MDPTEPTGPAGSASLRNRSIRASEAQWEAWERIAISRGFKDLSAWLRVVLDEAAANESGGVKPHDDPAFHDALGRLQARYMDRLPKDTIRRVVIAFRALLDEHGEDPLKRLDELRARLPGGKVKR